MLLLLSSGETFFHTFEPRVDIVELFKNVVLGLNNQLLAVEDFFELMLNVEYNSALSPWKQKQEKNLVTMATDFFFQTLPNSGQHNNLHLAGRGLRRYKDLFSQ